MPDTVPMFNPDNGKTADVHPSEVANMQGCGWRMREDGSQHVAANVAQPVEDMADRDGDGDGVETGVTSGLKVGKGPRGLIYIRRGRQIVSGPYDNEAKAHAALKEDAFN